MAKKTTKQAADDVIQFRLPKEMKRRYQEHCSARGEALTSWICGALADRFGREVMYQRIAGIKEDLQTEMKKTGAREVKT